MILVIGYGNPLRSDDGIGPRIAQVIEQRLNGKDVQIITAHQLTPELVEPISRARLVIFIDARTGGIPGMKMQEVVKAETGVGGAFTHHASPAALLGAAQALYGSSSQGILMTVTGASFEYGSELSPLLNRMLPTLADQVEAIIRTRAEAVDHQKEA